MYNIAIRARFTARSKKKSQFGILLLSSSYFFSRPSAIVSGDRLHINPLHFLARSAVCSQMSCTSCLSHNDIQTPDQESVPCTTPYFHKDTLTPPSSSRSPPVEGGGPSTFSNILIMRPVLLIPTPLVYICSFLQQHPTFCSFLKCFSFLCNIQSRMFLIYIHDYIIDIAALDSTRYSAIFFLNHFDLGYYYLLLL